MRGYPVLPSPVLSQKEACGFQAILLSGRAESSMATKAETPEAAPHPCQNSRDPLLGTLFGTYSIWHTFYLARTLFGTYSNWHILYLAHTLFGTYSNWHILYLAHTLVGAFSNLHRAAPDKKRVNSHSYARIALF